MPGPGEYRPDPTEGTGRVEDLPKTKIRCQSRNYRRRLCPRCGKSAYRDGKARRTLHDPGNPRHEIVIALPECSRRRGRSPGQLARRVSP